MFIIWQIEDPRRNPLTAQIEQAGAAFFERTNQQPTAIWAAATDQARLTAAATGYEISIAGRAAVVAAGTFWIGAP